jgi:hypothetical protein
MSTFYVYAFLRDDLTPYYIGKGKGNRAFVTSGRAIPSPQNPTHVVILACNLTEAGAFTLEQTLIRCFGRSKTNSGILHNLTEGGEGTSGYRHRQETKDTIGRINTNPSADRVAKIVAAVKGKPKSATHREALRLANIGKKLPEEQKQKMRLAHLGKKHSQEARDKMKGPRKPRTQEVNHAT